MDAPLLSYLLPPAIGALIGAVTNDVAIRMLFRPYQPWIVAGIRVPMTPGLIPRERHHIAEAIATTFVEHVFSDQDLPKMIFTDDVKDKIRVKVGSLLDQMGAMLKINEAMLGMAKGMASNQLIKELENLSSHLSDDSARIKEMIQQRIDALDVPTLEELVLGFSRKQFRHITWFGALLGGLIGVVQVILYQVLGVGA